MKTFRSFVTPFLDFLVSHFTWLCVLYSKFTFYLFRQDKRFLAMKNKYSGKRCFIVSLGPSLTISDLNLLNSSHEYCFSMNRCYQLFDKTEWRPDVYFISDARVNNNDTQAAIKKMIDDKIAVIYSKRDIKRMPSEALYYRANYADFIKFHSSNKRYRLAARVGQCSIDAGDFVYSAHSCVTSIIQVAYFLGFKEIYLIGQDCGVTSNLNHSEGITAEKNVNQLNDLDLVLYDFEELNKYITEKSIDLKIYNCTRGGRLEVFPRLKLEEVLNQK